MSYLLNYIDRCDFRIGSKGNAEVGLPFTHHGEGLLSRAISEKLTERLGGRWYDEGGYVFYSQPFSEDWVEVFRTEIHRIATELTHGTEE